MAEYSIPNLRNACALLKALAKAQQPPRLADLSRQLGIPSTTALRIVCTLEHEGFVRREGGQLRLGPALIYLGSTALKDTEIQREALPVLEALSKATDETSHVAVLCDQHALIVAVHDSPHPLGAASRPGTLADLHCSSTGKVFLSFGPEADAEALPSVVGPARTTNTITTLRELRDEIARVRARGYSIDNEEVHPGVRCLAAPVRDGSGTLVAAVGITAAASRFRPSDDERVARHVLQAAADLSRRLGGL